MWEFRAVALSELDLTAEQYWGSSLAELGEMLHGAGEAETRRWQRTAWMTAHLINIAGKSVKHEVTAYELLTPDGERRRELDAQWRADQEAERLKAGM